MLPEELLQHQLWWSGPLWLLMEPPLLPLAPPLNPPEMKATCLVANLTPDFDLLSSYTKLVNVTAWMLHFVHQTRKCKSEYSLSPCSVANLTASEVKEAELLLLTRTQRRCFPDELPRLHTDKMIKASSCLASLTPIISSSGLITVGGRLNNSSLSASQRHPIILSSKDILTKLLVATKHLALLHTGPTLLLSAIGANYHIVGVRCLIRTICSCVTCRRVSVAIEHQAMGQLPASRVMPSSPFSYTSMDFAGPFSMQRPH